MLETKPFAPGRPLRVLSVQAPGVPVGEGEGEGVAVLEGDANAPALGDAVALGGEPPL